MIEVASMTGREGISLFMVEVVAPFSTLVAGHWRVVNSQEVKFCEK
jgi:hypothetical protein